MSHIELGKLFKWLGKSEISKSQSDDLVDLKMLKNAYLVSKIGADTAENEKHSAEILPIGSRVADRSAAMYLGFDPLTAPWERLAIAGEAFPFTVLALDEFCWATNEKYK